MKKVFALLAVAGVFTFAACGGHEEKATEVAADSTAVVVDSTTAAPAPEVAATDSAAPAMEAAPATEEHKAEEHK